MSTDPQELARVHSGIDSTEAPHAAPARQWSPLGRGWFLVLLFTQFVILFGAVVRITGSGAGCGQHWPTCHGELAHLPQSLETAIELTHRVTSGLSALLVFGMTWLVFRAFPRGHQVRQFAGLSSLFMIFESLVGAALVLLRLVGNNDSVGRAVIMGLHLVNTLALVGAMSITLWLILYAPPQRGQLVSSQLFLSFSGARDLQRWAWWGAAVIAAVSAAGAITALGDTLYPVAQASTESALVVLEEATRTEGVHFLQILRGGHPIVAVLGSAFLMMGAGRLSDAEERSEDREAEVTPRTFYARVIASLVVTQVLAGLLNISLSAPGWMQVVHLGIANLLWMSWVWGWLFVASETRSETS